MLSQPHYDETAEEAQHIHGEITKKAKEVKKNIRNDLC